MCEEQPAYIAQILLDMERSRMFAEDCRAAMVCPYATSGVPPYTRPLSWREFGTERNDKLDHVTLNVIEPAKELLQDARIEMRRAFDDPNCNYKVALISAYNDVIDVEDCLKDTADQSESSSESES